MHRLLDFGMDLSGNQLEMCLSENLFLVFLFFFFFFHFKMSKNEQLNECLSQAYKLVGQKLELKEGFLFLLYKNTL